MDISHLLKDISIRHACKNIGTYVAELEKALGIKLKSAGDLKFTWSKDFKWYSDASDAKGIILYYFRQQKLKMFSVEDYDILGRYKLSFTFKFHPENAA